jgi:hypothetical protein
MVSTGLSISVTGLICGAMIMSCGNPPGSAQVQMGDIEIHATLPPNSTLADSVTVVLDADTLGTFANPHTVYSVVAGSHWLDVRYSDSVTDYQYSDAIIVGSGQTTQANWTLTAAGAYPGNPAPNFTVYDLDSNLVSLSGLSGKIVLLYFFETG